MVKIATDTRPHLRAVFANTGGKYDGVAAVQCGHVLAKVALGAITEDIDGLLAARVTGFGLAQHVTHVRRVSAQPQQAAVAV